MDDSRSPDLFAILRQLAIVSAALSNHPKNRDELLGVRDALVRAATQMGFSVNEEQQRNLCERLSGRPDSSANPPTRDHGAILAWALAHDVSPAEVRNPVFDGQPAALRFVSGDAKTGTPELKPITWDDFFARFDLMQLALTLDDETGDCQFVPA